MTPALIILATAASLGVGAVAASSLDYVAQIEQQANTAPAAPNRAANGLDSAAPVTPDEFGIGEMPCVSSPATPAGEMMICEGAATRIPSRVFGEQFALAPPVRVYVHKHNSEIASIALDVDGLKAQASSLGLLVERAKEDRIVTKCSGTSDYRVFVVPTGFVVVASITVPSPHAVTVNDNTTGESSLTVYLPNTVRYALFVPATAGLDCTPDRAKVDSNTHNSAESARRSGDDW